MSVPCLLDFLNLIAGRSVGQSVYCLLYSMQLNRPSALTWFTSRRCLIIFTSIFRAVLQTVSASEMTYIVSSGALNSTHSLTPNS